MSQCHLTNDSIAVTDPSATKVNTYEIFADWTSYYDCILLYKTTKGVHPEFGYQAFNGLSLKSF